LPVQAVFLIYLASFDHLVFSFLKLIYHQAHLPRLLIMEYASETEVTNAAKHIRSLNGSAPVPEPSTSALVGLAFVGFILRRSRA
jgi:hypothetical protein